MAPVLNGLETDRLRMRLPSVADAPIHHRLWTERDPRVPPHRRIDAEGRPTEEDIAAKLRIQLEASTPGLLTVVVKDSDEVIGYCGVVFDEHASPDEPELVFELLRAHQNLGYATEAGKAVIEWAAAAGYRRLRATVWDWNVESRRVLEKLGFHETGRVGATSAHGLTLVTERVL